MLSSTEILKWLREILICRNKFLLKNKVSTVTFSFGFRDRVSLCSPGCPGTHSVDQAGLELRNPPASASQVLGLNACTTSARLHSDILKLEISE
jgi:hypothetical protein